MSAKPKSKTGPAQAAYARKTIRSPIGPLTLVSRGNRLAAILFGGYAPGKKLPSGIQPVRSSPVLDETEKQLRDYFSGKRRRFRLPLAPEGTAFQRKVWRGLEAIPFGKTLSYGELAAHIRQPRAARAVGMANNKNPLPIIIPCHRVIGANGRMVGYGGGLKIKAFLLKHEGLDAAA